MYGVIALLVGAGIMVALAVREHLKEDVAPRRAYRRAVRKLRRAVTPVKD